MQTVEELGHPAPRLTTRDGAYGTYSRDPSLLDHIVIHDVTFTLPRVGNFSSFTWTLSRNQYQYPKDAADLLVSNPLNESVSRNNPEAIFACVYRYYLSLLPDPGQPVAPARLGSELRHGRRSGVHGVPLNQA
jgi:hypothetical protein